MRRLLALSFIICFIICAECQEPGDDPTTTRKSLENELFQNETITTTTSPTDTPINTTLSSTEIENNSTTSSDDTSNIREKSSKHYDSSTSEEYLTIPYEHTTVREETLTNGEVETSNTPNKDASEIDDDIKEYGMTTTINTQFDDQEELLVVQTEQDYDETILTTTENEFMISIKDVFEKSLNVAKEDLPGIGIIQDWLKEEAMAATEPATDDYEYTLATDDYTNVNDIDDEEENTNEEFIGSLDRTTTEAMDQITAKSENKKADAEKEQEEIVVEKIEHDLEKLNNIDLEEGKENAEREEVIQDIEKNLSELEASSSKVKETPTTVLQQERATESEIESESTTTEENVEIEITTEFNNSDVGEIENEEPIVIPDEIIETLSVVDALRDTEKEEITEETIIDDTTNENDMITTTEISTSEEHVTNEITDIRYNNIQEETPDNDEISSEVNSEVVEDLSIEVTTEFVSKTTIPQTGELPQEKLPEEEQPKEEYETTTEDFDATTETLHFNDADLDNNDTIVITSEITTEKDDAEPTPTVISTEEKQTEELVNEITTEIINQEIMKELLPTSTIIEKIEEVTQVDYTMLVIPDGQPEDINRTNATTPGLAEEIINDIIEEIEKFEDVPTTTASSTELPSDVLLEKTINLTKSINNILKEENDLVPILTSNTLKDISASSEDSLIINDKTQTFITILPDSDVIAEEEIIKSLEEEYLPSNAIDGEHTKILGSHKDMTVENGSDEDNAFEEIDQYSDVAKKVVPEHKVSALLIDNASGDVCLNASGLQIKITTNDQVTWIPTNSKIYGECSSSEAVLNFTWKLNKDDKGVQVRNATLSFTFNWKYDESYIEEVNFKSSQGDFTAYHLEKHLTDPTIIKLSKDIKVIITHPNIQLYYKAQDYATTLLSADNAMALQIASGGLCLFIVIIAVGIYAYKRLRSQTRIFKVSLDKS